MRQKCPIGLTLVGLRKNSSLNSNDYWIVSSLIKSFYKFSVLCLSTVRHVQCTVLKYSLSTVKYSHIQCTVLKVQFDYNYIVHILIHIR